MPICKNLLFLFVPLSLISAASGPFPDPAVDLEKSTVKTKQTAVFAGGCFWCTEAVFEQLKGVEKVVSGYSGGDAATAHYKIVGEGRTEHAEAIQITYDSSRVSYGQLLKIFFSVAHDPTQLNRQGPDYGKQYRSAIFCANDDQRRVAEAYIEQLSQGKVFPGPIVTLVVSLKAFFPAEAYHQDFVRNNPDHPYVVANALPKLQKMKKLYPDWVKK
ncbi:MAG: peptide-methionine (S)-S-oxide reductase MsrA [Acidobacteria bacterium]|nr:peptide-methionine (S)-S-oxide reductase MsrA [Acidobacteriota bacterium]